MLTSCRTYAVNPLSTMLCYAIPRHTIPHRYHVNAESGRSTHRNGTANTVTREQNREGREVTSPVRTSGVTRHRRQQQQIEPAQPSRWQHPLSPVSVSSLPVLVSLPPSRSTAGIVRNGHPTHAPSDMRMHRERSLLTTTGQTTSSAPERGEAMRAEGIRRRGDGSRLG